MATRSPSSWQKVFSRARRLGAGRRSPGAQNGTATARERSVAWRRPRLRLGAMLETPRDSEVYMRAKPKATIAGVGELAPTRKADGRSSVDLMLEASRLAMLDAGLA